MEELDLREIFRIFWNEKLKIIFILIFFIEIGVIYTMHFVKPVYSASTTLVLATSNTESAITTATSITTAEITINSKLVSTYSELVKSKNILREVMKNLNLNMDEDELRRSVDVNSVKNTELIEITVTNPDRFTAERIANEIAKVFTDRVKEIYKIENVHIVDVAEVPEEPSNINHKRDVLIFAAGGLLVAIAYVFLVNIFDTTIKSPEDIENTYQLSVLASVPLYKENMKGGKKNEERANNV